MRESLPGLVLIIAAALLWSTGGLMIKAVAADGVVVAAVRCLLAGLLFAPFLWRAGLRWSWQVAGLLLFYPLMSVAFVLANKWTTAANAVVLQYTAPLWIFTVQAAWGKVPLSARRTGPMLLIAAGIVLFLLEPATGKNLLGNLTALVSGAAFAGVIIFFRLLRSEPAFPLVSLTNLVTALFLAPAVLLTPARHQFLFLSAADWAGLVYLGMFQIGLAYVCYAWGLRWVNALRAATVSLLEPVLSPLWVWLFLSEVPTSWGFAGAAAILIGLAFDLWLNRETG